MTLPGVDDVGQFLRDGRTKRGTAEYVITQVIRARVAARGGDPALAARLHEYAVQQQAAGVRLGEILTAILDGSAA